MKNLPLTLKEKTVLKQIKKYIESNQYPPTAMEIAMKIGSTNHQTGTYYINQLKDKGYITLEKGKWRNIRLIEN